LRDAVATSDSCIFAAPKRRAPGQEPIPGYRLIQFLGRGGFGEVWKCEAPGGLFKAVKFVFGNLTGFDADSASARQELEALQRIKAIRHPFILSLDRVEIVGGELVIVMELADRSLQDRFDECPTGIPRDELLGYLMEAAEALDLMNLRHRLLHLDIKPGNLFLVADHVKVADFGLVNGLGEKQESLGGITPLYSAPETFMGKLSPQSDQYSLAVAYQHLLTGKPPFDGKTARQLAIQHVNHQPKMEGVPGPDIPILLRALSKNPEDRFPSTLEFIHGLMLAGAGSTDSRPKPEEGRPDTSRVLRYRLQNMGVKSHPINCASSPASPRGAGETRPGLPRNLETVHERTNQPGGGPVLPGYQFVALVGQTPFGEVWKCKAPDGRMRRLRLLPSLPVHDPKAARDALEQLCVLSHPAIPATTMLETETGRLVLSTELFEQTVVDRCRICQAQRLPGIPRAELLGYLWTAAEALDYLHIDAQKFHLALTPYHLALSGDAVMVADAGLAEIFGVTAFLRATQAARYAAPELFEGEMRAACDQYSLAMVFCELLTGLHPFRGQSLQRLAKVRERPRPALDLLTAGDRSVVVRALDLDPERRFASCSEFVQALETGNGEPEVTEGQGFVPLTQTPNLLSDPPLGADPAQAIDRLHQLLAELGSDVALAPAPSGTRVNPRIGFERRCGARVFSATARLKLEGFRQQWNAKVTRVEPAFIGYRIDMAQGFWSRCLGKEKPGVEVTFQFQQPQTLNAELTEVTINIWPVGCNAEQGTRILNQAAPMILENARSYLQATPERRGLDRLKYGARIQVTPVFPGQPNGSPMDCVAKDISIRGIGFLSNEDTASRQILVMLPGKGTEGAIFLPAEIVRVHRRADGCREVGARFAFGGFHAGMG
jgi:serine/threonine protein kinase